MAKPKAAASQLFVRPAPTWTADELRAIEATQRLLARNPVVARVFEYICTKQGDERIDGPLSSQAVLSANGLREKQLTELRERAAYHSAYMDAHQCPYVLLIERDICRLRLIPKQGGGRLRLPDLADRERLEPEGHVVPGGEILIYVHQATGLPSRLLEQMLENMEAAVTYRYFIPQACAQNVVNILIELLNHPLNPVEQTLRILTQGFEVNVVAEALPVFFSIHNASNEERALMYVRSPASTKELIRYGDNRWAHEQYRVLMRSWRPVVRTRRSPIVVPCKDVRLPQTLRMTLDRLLRKEERTKSMASEILRAMLGPSRS